MLKKLLPLLAAVLFFSIPTQAADESGGTAAQGGSTISVMYGVTRIDTGTVNAAGTAPVYYPVQVQTTEEGEKLLVVKTFEVPGGTPAQNLVEQELTRDGLRYEVRDILQKELEGEPEYKTVSKAISMDTDNDDEQALISRLSPVIFLFRRHRYLGPAGPPDRRRPPCRNRGDLRPDEKPGFYFGGRHRRDRRGL